MKATIENLSATARTRWVDLLCPIEVVSGMPAECELILPDGARWRAARGRTIGDQTVYHVRAQIAGKRRVTGDLSVPATPMSSPPPWTSHPWVGDDWARLVPDFGVRVAGVDHWSTGTIGGEEFSSPAMKRVWLRASIPTAGLICEWWADIYHDDPVVTVWGKIIWSDRSDPSWNRTFDAVMLRSGEAIQFDFATRHGITVGPRGSDGTWTYVLGTNVPFSDGSGLPLSGQMQCLRDQPDVLTQAELQATLANLSAVDGGPVVGIAHRDGGNWLALGRTPRVPAAQLAAAEELAWNQHNISMWNRVGWHAQRPLGSNKRPADVGDQEDFAATPCALAVSANAPRQILRFRYSVQAELFRGCEHYENGVPLNIATHPQWVTLDQRTHYHPNVSRDRLGKLAGPDAPLHGWYGEDNQHRSDNGTAGYLSLCDDPVMHSHLQHVITTDRADYRRRYPANGPDAARGQGRLLQAWSHLFSATGDQQFVALNNAQIEQSHRNMLQLSPGPMRALSVNRADGRKPVYVNGVLSPSVCIWEHAIALIGLRAAQRRMVVTGPAVQNLAELVAAIANLLAEWGMVPEVDVPSGDIMRWHTVLDFAWNHGAPPPGPWQKGNPAINADAPGSGVGGWARAGLLLACDVLGPQDPRHDRLSAYLRTVITDPDPDYTWAEWWAASGQL